METTIMKQDQMAEGQTILAISFLRSSMAHLSNRSNYLMNLVCRTGADTIKRHTEVKLLRISRQIIYNRIIELESELENPSND